MYVASWSGGKDSTASIILAHEHQEPLDLIIFSEVMFDDNTSGELPEHIEFIHRTIERFREWGYTTKILRSDKTYMECFNHRIKNSKHPNRIGKKRGFPLSGMCVINRDCKVRPIREFNKKHPQAVHYVGIAVDEPKRLARVNVKREQVSLLEKYKLTESDAYALCDKYGMLSPIYGFTKRGGCWFCPNARRGELRHLYDCHRNLWDRLCSLEQDDDIVNPYWDSLNKRRINEIGEMFRDEDRQMNIGEWIKRREDDEAVNRQG